MFISLPNRRQTPIAYKLLLLIIISSALVTLIITAIQLFFDYKTDINLIKKRIHQIEVSYLDSVANSVWNFNSKQYNIQLEGILNIEDIIYVEINDPDGKLIASKGKLVSDQVIKSVFHLHTTDFGKEIDTGNLIIIASLSRVYQELIKKGMLILFTQFIKTLLISAVIIFTFYHLVTRHLWKISDYVCQQDISKSPVLVLDKTVLDQPDELDKVVNAINTMKARLLDNYHHIKELNQELEQKVLVRTKSLNETNHQLKKERQRLEKAQEQLLQQRKKLEIQATIDPLTQIYNRRKFQEIIDMQWRYTVRNKLNLAVIMLDIDFFKLYNDNYGHGLGDKTLKMVAQALKEALHRPFDSVSRYGGEEFIILLADIELQGARQVTQRIQQSIKKLSIVHNFSPISKYITLSIGGFIGSPNNSDNSSDFLKNADRLLYQAKKEGRNRVIWNT